MINISYGTCDMCLNKHDLSTRVKASIVVLTINHKQLEFCEEHFKEFIDMLDSYYKENFSN